MSNATLDHPWPKVLRGKAALREEMRRAAARAPATGTRENRRRVETRENVETRVENVETRVENVETRVENVETRVENVETRVENVETRASSLADLPSPFVRPGDAANETGVRHAMFDGDRRRRRRRRRDGDGARARRRGTRVATGRHHEGRIFGLGV